eukprot:SAG11_NODE_21472_length_424_cov_1.187692_1_plen_59_part_00
MIGQMVGLDCVLPTAIQKGLNSVPLRVFAVGTCMNMWSQYLILGMSMPMVGLVAHLEH